MVQNARKFLKDITYIKDLMNYPFETEGDYIEQVKLEKMDLAAGSVNLRMDVEDKYYYENMSELTGVENPWRIPADIHGQRVSRDEKRVRKSGGCHELGQNERIWCRQSGTLRYYLRRAGAH